MQPSSPLVHTDIDLTSSLLISLEMIPRSVEAPRIGFIIRTPTSHLLPLTLNSEQHPGKGLSCPLHLGTAVSTYSVKIQSCTGLTKC